LLHHETTHSLGTKRLYWLSKLGHIHGCMCHLRVKMCKHKHFHSASAKFCKPPLITFHSILPNIISTSTILKPTNTCKLSMLLQLCS
jgi:hypothetical protein